MNIKLEVRFYKILFFNGGCFNHGATAWNLMKPVIASEINHVEQEFQTEIGIVIVASLNLKKNCWYG